MCVGAVLIVAAMAALVTELPAATLDAIADRVLGQIDCSHKGPTLVDRSDLHKPDTIEIDLSVLPNRLYVADTENSRVLVGET